MLSKCQCLWQYWWTGPLVRSKDYFFISTGHIPVRRQKWSPSFETLATSQSLMQISGKAASSILQLNTRSNFSFDFKMLKSIKLKVAMARSTQWRELTHSLTRATFNQLTNHFFLSLTLCVNNELFSLNEVGWSYLLLQTLGHLVDLLDGSRDDPSGPASFTSLHREGFSAAGLPVRKDAHVVAVDGALKVNQYSAHHGRKRWLPSRHW